MGKLRYNSYISGSYELDPELQFGFETEFFALGPCFDFYELEPTLGLSLEGPVEEKARALQQFCRTLSHGDKRKVMRKKAGPAFLPETLHRDDTGNVELVLGPEGDFSAFRTQFNWVNEKLGVGSMQAMVSLPRMSFFGENPVAGAQAHLGWLNFFNELDILERIEQGRERLELEPTKGPLRSFLHPYLGPMTSVRHRLLKKFLRENSKGDFFDEENIVRPARRDHSFKFVGSTAYRPDVAGPARICFEVRDAHRDPTLLMNRVARILFYWQSDLSAFTDFAEIPPFDSAAAFDSLPAEIQNWLREVCPNRAPAAVKGFEKAEFAYEVFRNFAYPMRDWRPWFELLSPGASGEKMATAQKNYVERLRLATGEKGEVGLLCAQKALVDFGDESGLLQIFREKEHTLAEALK